MPGSQDAFLPKGALRGLRYIFVDEWGPYDFSRVKVSPEQPVFWGDGELRIFGPPTPFIVQDITDDVHVSPLQGELPATLKISADRKQMHRFAFSLKLPERREAIPVSGLLLYADWNVTFYSWQGAGPRKPPATGRRSWPVLCWTSAARRRSIFPGAAAVRASAWETIISPPFRPPRSICPPANTSCAPYRTTESAC